MWRSLAESNRSLHRERTGTTYLGVYWRLIDSSDSNWLNVHDGPSDCKDHQIDIEPLGDAPWKFRHGLGPPQAAFCDGPKRDVVIQFIKRGKLEIGQFTALAPLAGNFRPRCGLPPTAQAMGWSSRHRPRRPFSK